MKAIGQHLRTTRQERGEDLYDIAEFLRIRPSYLFAIEEGDLDAMPGRPYALGFLRSYCDYLGFDGNAVAAEVRTLIEGAPKSVPLRPKRPVESGGPAWSLIAASLIIILAGLGGWRIMQGGQSDVWSQIAGMPGELGAYLSRLVDEGDGAGGEESPGIPANQAERIETAGTDAGSGNGSSATAPAETVTAEVASQPSEPAPASQPATIASAVSSQGPLPDRLEAGEPLDTAQLGALPETVLARLAPPRLRAISDPTSANASVIGDDAEIAADSAEALLGSLTDSAGAQARIYGAELADARVVLLAKESSWIQIKSTERDYIRSRTLEAGERFALPDRDDLALWTGNAGGLEVLVDGRNLGSLGDRGTVMRDVILVPEALIANIRR